MYLVFVLYALFASVFTIAKTGLDYAQPLFLVGSRMLVAGIFLLAYEYWRRPEKFTIRRRDLPRMLLLGMFNIYLTNALEFWGLQFLTSFKTCFIYSLTPFLSALFSYMVLSESISPKKWLGLLIGFAGFLPILLTQDSGEEGVVHFFFLSWAELSVLGAAVCSVYGWVLLRQLINEDGYTTKLANGFSMLFGGIMSLINSFVVEDWSPLPVSGYLPFFESTLALIVISNLICYNLYGHLLKRFSATFMSFAGFTTPLFTALYGWFFLGESVTWVFYLSCVIVFIGLSLFYQEELTLHPQTN